MKMQRNYVPRSVIVRKGRNLGSTVPDPVEYCIVGLALLRHSLSQYRKYANRAIHKLPLQTGKPVRNSRIAK
jgi:hypothetical protein